MNEKPRLLVLASTYPRWSGDSEPGFVHELSRRLTDHFDVTVVCPAAPGAPLRQRMGEVTVLRFRYALERLQTLVNDGGIVSNLKASPWKWTLVPLFVAAELLFTWRVIRTVKPDVVHAHWIIPQGLILAILSLVIRRMPKFLVTSHGADLHALRFWPMPALKRFVVGRASVTTVVSSSMLGAMRAQGISTKGVRVEPMGVDLEDRFVPDPSIARSQEEILFVGRLVEKKGLRHLLDALVRVIENNSDAYLTIVGFGPEEQVLRRQSEFLGISDKVRFVGPVSQERLPDYYRRAAVFAAPFVEASGGDQEGLGLVTVEAIGCGCPVIVSDLPAVSDVVDDSGFRVRPADPAALADRINFIMNMSADQLSAQVREMRVKMLDRFSWGSRASSYQAILKAEFLGCGTQR